MANQENGITQLRPIYCPITKQKFIDPVILNCGHTFERQSIKDQINCPYKSCRQPINIRIPNLAVRELIQLLNFQDNDFKDDRLTRQDDQANQSQISDNSSNESNPTITLPCGHQFSKFYVDWLLKSSKTCIYCPTPIPNDILFKRTISNDTYDKVPSPKSKKEQKKKDNSTGEMSNNQNPTKHDTSPQQPSSSLQTNLPNNSKINHEFKLNCGHQFHLKQLQTWFRNDDTCPTCHKYVSNTVRMQCINGANVYEPPNIIESPKLNADEDSDSSRGIQNVDTNLSELSASFTESGDLINLQIKVPECTERNPASIVCIIDVSGSMETAVGKAEGNKAFTRLDLVKHVLNVIIECVEGTDKLSFITFSEDPKLELCLMQMSDAGKTFAKEVAKRIKTFGTTQTIPAIELAYEVLKESPPNNLNTIILLTDGQDTGGKEAFRYKIEQLKPPKNVQLHTFGFSNDIWSDSLKDLAIKGGGVFGFIPDQTMIGTVFLNCIASTFLTFAQNVSIKFDDEYEIVCPSIKTNNIALYYGQTKNFVLRKLNKGNDVGISFKIISQKGWVNLTAKKETNESEFMRQMARIKVLEFLTDKNLPNIRIQKYVESKTIQYVKEFLCEFQQIGEPDPNNEQMTLALQNYDTWGEHYLNSMFFAHRNEQCLNFKSPSMQIYTNKQFLDLVDSLTDIFINLQLPEPTGYSRNNSAPQINTTTMMNRDSGCILGTCNIKMESGEYKPIKKLKRGDIVYGGARIVCLIKTRYHGSLIKIGKLFITPFHPVFIDNKWQFPYDVVMNNNESSNGLIVESGEGTFVFNLVLDKDHIVDVEGVGCITLGHMYDEGILKHDYFGTNKVIEDLSKLNGWNEGIISLKSYKIQRDSNGNVSGTSCHVYQL